MKEQAMKREEKQRILAMLEDSDVEVVKTGRKYITVRVRDIYGNPKIKKLSIDSIDETTFIGA